MPPYLKATPDEESAHFVTFFAADGTRAIRIMNPVALYPPGSAKATAVPADYATYLDTLAAAGVQLTNRIETTVDGHRAVVVTAASSTSLDGSIGCQAANLEAAVCFGVGEDVIVRLTAIDTGAGPLLMWMRLRVADSPDLAVAATDFAAFLEGVRFASREAQPEPTPAYAGLDGTYTWTITLADAKSDANPPAPDDVPTFPWVFTMSLSGGIAKLRVEFAVGGPQAGSGTYEAAPDRLTLHFGGVAQVYAVKQDKDGTIHLTAVDVKDPGDAFVNTVKPWRKVP